MIFKRPGKATKTKKIIYLIASTILGLIMSLIAHAFIEMVFLSWAVERELPVEFYSGCALPPPLQIGLVIVGAVSGFFVGRIWWRKIYVERVWLKKFGKRR